ncbi:NADH dehydrogenase [Massilia sp. WF1]|uniref:NAD(P)/FAD-dependent oxidoreductase n=1 Tax=unclassified Massilia TaxID=2609279 RepID=UPI00064B3A0E|nr:MULTISPECIES: FAD-dependent oxidoreductase [unclassified Massilia]ALK96878.1 NADH dehydrogenase [Massilia sp. WG5]KLU38220.1 NADH dehydrogenase [Massilia sp. WF1]
MYSEIVIVGGGAGGLELACKLGRKLGPSKVTLVDSRLYHVWKPSLHEVAAGTLDIHQEGLSYQMLAHDRGFTFVYGAMTALDAANKVLGVGPVKATSDGEEIFPARTISYRSLVIAVGSTSNYFGVPGAREHTISLNATEDAERFRLRLLRLLAQAAEAKGEGATNPGVAVAKAVGAGSFDSGVVAADEAGGAAVADAALAPPKRGGGLDIVIIGGGATGVELAAELREASGAYAAYGFNRLQVQRDVRITLLEGAPRILAPLPERVSASAARLLDERAIRVVTDCRVTRIDARQVVDKDGHVYPSDICVWAAGIRAPEFLASLGLPTNKGGAIEVDGHLRVKGVEGVYALGDCAACTDGKGNPVPPRAQAAHQQADYLMKTFMNMASGRPPQKDAYVYKDYGSLVSIGHQTTVGNLMGSLRATWFVEGFVARIMYTSLHLMHHQAVLGAMRTGVLAVARYLIRRTTPLVKLH